MESFLGANDLQAGAVAAVGFHGQTLLHRPERGLTLQIGDGAALAARLGIPVVYDFRAADVAAGGQGAPLAPIYHRALVRRLALPPPVAVLNIGGVANVTYIDGDDLIACDTGPGNACSTISCGCAPGIRSIPTAARPRPARSTRQDRRLMAHPFFALPPPKSLDRNDFRGFVGDTLDGIGVEDGAATLTALSAAAVARIVPLLPRPPADLDRGRRRRAQSDADAHAGGAPYAGADRDQGMRSAGRSIRSRRRRSLISRCAACAGCRSAFRAPLERRGPLTGGVLARP